MHMALACIRLQSAYLHIKISFVLPELHALEERSIILCTH